MDGFMFGFPFATLGFVDLFHRSLPKLAGAIQSSCQEATLHGESFDVSSGLFISFTLYDYVRCGLAPAIRRAYDISGVTPDNIEESAREVVRSTGGMWAIWIQDGALI